MLRLGLVKIGTHIASRNRVAIKIVNREKLSQNILLKVTHVYVIFIVLRVFSFHSIVSISTLSVEISLQHFGPSCPLMPLQINKLLYLLYSLFGIPLTDNNDQ